MRLLFGISMLIVFSFLIVPLSYSQTCEGWGGVIIGGEEICCSCSATDGICPDLVAGVLVCVYGDLDCGTCDTLPPTVSWVDPTASTSWIDGSYAFTATGTDNAGLNEQMRNMSSIGEFFVNGNFVGVTEGSDGINGDQTLSVWKTYDTNVLTNGTDHNFTMEMKDLNGNAANSSTLTITVCNDKDPQTCQDACTETPGMEWLTNQSTDNFQFCCGDDANEYRILDYDPSYGYACCPNPTDCSFREMCFRIGTEINTAEYGADFGVLRCEGNKTVQVCDHPSHVGHVNISGECCTVEGISELGEFKVIYHQIPNSSITSEGYFPSGWFDGLDTDCSGEVDDCTLGHFEGLGINSINDFRAVDYYEWQTYYQGIGFAEYNKSTVEEKCCTDGTNNDGNVNNEGHGCADEYYYLDGGDREIGYADWKCQKEINNVEYTNSTGTFLTMFDLVDNDCDGNFDFGRVPPIGNWSSNDQATEKFETGPSESAKIRVYGNATSITGEALPNVKITMWLRDDWYNELEREREELKTINDANRDYFTTTTDKNGGYEIYINAHMPYTFVASQPEAIESEETYVSAIKSIDPGMIGFNIGEYKWDPVLWPSDMVRCDGCKLAGSNRCYAGCIGNEYCSFPEWADTEEEQRNLIYTCADVLSSTAVKYNSTHEVLCCNGPLMIMPEQIESNPLLEENIKTAATYTETVSLEGVPVKMKIVLFETE
ncbi:MAG: hypothetical protein PWR30_302 [Candidatus Woesearchaeota archaeon]|nr:hypothetical protein [Candidatus Woesearchaeota archaeon]